MSSYSLKQFSCKVQGCINQEPGTDFFPFPQDKSILEEWKAFCKENIPDEDLPNSYVCSKHFEETAFITEIRQVGNKNIFLRTLNDFVIPTLFPPNSNTININKDLNEENLDFSKYENIKTKNDLMILRETNKNLKNKIENLKNNIAKARNSIEVKKNQVYSSLKNSRNSPIAKNILSKVFTPTQIKHLVSGRNTRWSEDDYAMGCTIRYLTSEVFYKYLTNELKYPFPSDSSLRRCLSIKRKNLN